MNKKELKQDICILSEYIDTLEYQGEMDSLEIVALQNTIEKVAGENHKLNEHIKMLEKQLLQSNHYNTRKDEENAVLKRMYRDDIINGYVER